MFNLASHLRWPVLGYGQTNFYAEMKERNVEKFAFSVSFKRGPRDPHHHPPCRPNWRNEAEFLTLQYAAFLCFKVNIIAKPTFNTFGYVSAIVSSPEKGY